MAKRRVFLDECCSENDLKTCFPSKAHVFVATDFGLRGKQDPKVIDTAVQIKCLIITVNKDFVDYYRKHPLRKGRKLPFFYGLIFLKPSKVMTRRAQLQTALKAIDWGDTRDHEDLIFVSAQGKTRHERLCHPECAKPYQTLPNRPDDLAPEVSKR